MKTISKKMTLILMIIMPFFSLSQTEGPNIPLSIGNQPLAYCAPCYGAIWYNTNFVAATDGQYSNVQLSNTMFCFQDSCFRSRYLTCNNFNFSIPSSAIILGIEVDVAGYSNLNSAVADQEIRLSHGNVMMGDNMASTTFWAGSDSIRSYGNASSLWGMALSPADINHSGFGVYIKVYNTAMQTASVFVDEVSMKITYALGTEVFSTTLSPNPVYVNTNYLTGNFDVTFQMPQGSDGADCYMYDINGKKYYSSELKSMPGQNSELHINTESLSSGTYLINIITENKHYAVKASLVK